MEIVKTLGIEDLELWKCPDEYIDLLKGKNNKNIEYIHLLKNNEKH